MNVLKTMPKYEVTQQEDPRNPFLTVVLVNGEAMGRGAYANKKTSKRLAAEDALKRLCPSLYEQSKIHEEDAELPVEERVYLKHADEILSWVCRFAPCLSMMSFSDLRAPERLAPQAANDKRLERLTITAKTPLQLLYEYCNRYHAQPQWTEVPVTSAQATTFDVKCMLAAHDGRLLTVSVNARTKKEGKQQVSHKILLQLYPNARTWGELVDQCVVRRDEDDRVATTLSFLERIKADIRKQRSEAALPSQAASVAAYASAAKSHAPLPPVMYQSTASVPARVPEFYNASAVRVATSFLTSLQSSLGVAPGLAHTDRERQRSASPVVVGVRGTGATPAISSSASKYYHQGYGGQQYQQQQHYGSNSASAYQYDPAYARSAGGRTTGAQSHAQWRDSRDRSPVRDRERDHRGDHRDHREYRDPPQTDYRYVRPGEPARAAPLPTGRQSHSPPPSSAYSRGRNY